MLLCLIWMALFLKGKNIATSEANSLTETISKFDLVTALQFSPRGDPSASLSEKCRLHQNDNSKLQLCS